MGAWLYSQFIYTPKYPTTPFTGQVVIITGANVGLGLEAARHFVRLDAAKVILAVRNLDKGEVAKESILKSEKKTADVVEVWKLDLSSFQSIKDFAKKAQSLERLDVLIENAGIYPFKWRMMEDNESSIQTNAVGPIFHAMLILPKLRETAVKFKALPRLVFVGSFVHWMTKFPQRNEANTFEALADEKKAMMGDRWVSSELRELWSFAISKV